MMKKKTHRQFMQDLPKDIRDKAISNTEANYGVCAYVLFDKQFYSLRDALYSSFSLSRSKEGWDYWQGVINEYSKTN